MPKCKKCSSQLCAKNGVVRVKQRYLCKEYGYNFVEGDKRTNEKIIVKKAMCVLFYSLGKGSYNMPAKIFDTWPSLVYRWIKEAGANVSEPTVSGEITEMEFDEMWHFIGNKKTNFGLSDRSTRTTVAWVLGNRDSTTFRRLYTKVMNLKKCTFYTDNWGAFSKVFPADRHIIGTAYTHTIERDNSNTRHHLGRFTRKTKIVSKSEDMVETTLKLWIALTNPKIKKKHQDLALSIFKQKLSISFY